jgi:hypothetical protein
MKRLLVYDGELGVFRFTDEEEVALAVLAGSERIRCYGSFDFPEAISFPTFSPSQLVDALTWATGHGTQKEAKQVAENDQGEDRRTRRCSRQPTR